MATTLLSNPHPSGRDVRTQVPEFRRSAASYMREVANLCNGRLKVFGGAGESSLRGQRPDGHFTCEPNKVGGSIPQLFLAAANLQNAGIGVAYRRQGVPRAGIYEDRGLPYKTLSWSRPEKPSSGPSMGRLSISASMASMAACWQVSSSGDSSVPFSLGAPPALAPRRAYPGPNRPVAVVGKHRRRRWRGPCGSYD